jgi:CheY-like chemotaxis protein
MSLKLTHQPGRVAVLDDDVSYLEALSLALPASWQLRCYGHPQACIKDVADDRVAWENRRQRLYSWIGLWRENQPLLSRILKDLVVQAPAYGLTKVLVVDYAMPGKNGLEVLQELHGLAAGRILLTGLADEQLAVKAFNNRLIEQFVQKHSVDVGQLLKQAISDLFDRVDLLESQTWCSVFSPAQIAVLQRQDVSSELHQLAAKRWVEYMVLSEPFGVLGFDRQGRAGWLQLETQASLSDLVEMASTLGVNADLILAVEDQKILLSLEVQQVLKTTGVELTGACIAMGKSEPLLGAWFELPPQYARPAASSYEAFMDTHPRQIIG